LFQNRVAYCQWRVSFEEESYEKNRIYWCWHYGEIHGAKFNESGKHFVKDMQLALKEAETSGLHLEVLRQVLDNYEELEAGGYGHLGTQALMKHYE